MYVIPLIAFAIVIVIAAAWSPIFALIIAIPLLAVFLVLIALGRRSREGSGQTTRESAEGSRSSSGPASGEGGS